MLPGSAFELLKQTVIKRMLYGKSERIRRNKRQQRHSTYSRLHINTMNYWRTPSQFAFFYYLQFTLFFVLLEHLFLLLFCARFSFCNYCVRLADCSISFRTKKKTITIFISIGILILFFIFFPVSVS